MIRSSFLCHGTVSLICLLVSCEAFAQNPFNSSQPGYPLASPFESVDLKDNGDIRVMVDGEWYQLRKIDGVSAADILQKCRDEKWPPRLRITEDIIQILRLMGSKTDLSVDLDLLDKNERPIRIEGVEATNKKLMQSVAFSLALENPFASIGPDYPRCSPFTGVKFEEGKTKVRFKGDWYEPVSIHDLSFNKIVEACKTNGWDFEKRFSEDLVQIVRLMGKEIDHEIDVVLKGSDGKSVEFTGVEMSTENLRAVKEYVRTSRYKLDAKSINEDLVSLKNQLEAQFSYLNTNGFDYAKAIDGIRNELVDIDFQKLALMIDTKVMNQFIDGHGGVSSVSYGNEKFLPFLVEVSGDRYIALQDNRNDFLDSQHPYIESIDGLPIDDWIEVSKDCYPKGSRQYCRRNGLRTLRHLPYLRILAGKPESDKVSVRLRNEKDGGSHLDLNIDLGDDVPVYGLWPRQTESKMLDDNIGYLRIVSMNDDAVANIKKWMPKLINTKGLIVDVRCNGGGIRLPLLELAAYLMKFEDEPRIGNVACYRLFDQFEKDHLSEARHVYRESNPIFDARDLETISKFKAGFKPEWEPDKGKFSEWHYMVLSKKKDDPRFFYDKPVMILCDEKCFSATDIFLGAFKGWPNVTLVGQASGGGSARSQRIRLRNTGIAIRCASMASFQPNGKLYDTNGVEPDVEVIRPPEYFLNGGKDSILEKAKELILQR